MFTKISDEQKQMELVILDQLVSEDHLLRKIDKHIDFTFIYDLVEDTYCLDNGRPSKDVVSLFKMILIGYLYGIRSERRLVEEVHHNNAYRWFAGFTLTEKIPDASLFSKLRNERFKGLQVYEKIFNKIVEQAIEKKLIKGKIIYTDSTHIKANASKSKFNKDEYVKAGVKYALELDNSIDEIRSEKNQKPLKKKNLSKIEVKKKKTSTTDSESAFMTRDRKPQGFFYLNHLSVDSRYGLVVDTFVTPGNVNDATPFASRLEYIKNKFGLEIKYVGADAGYFTNIVAKELYDLSIQPVIATKRHRSKDGLYSKSWFQYVPDWDVYMCPNGYSLEYKTVTTSGYKEYHQMHGHCINCEKRDKCISKTSDSRIIRRHVWENHLESIRYFMKTDIGRRIYARRKETVERTFADAKELHGLRYARMRGLEKVQEQCYMTHVAQNIKKIAMILHRRSLFIFLKLLNIQIRDYHKNLKPSIV